MNAPIPSPYLAAGGLAPDTALRTVNVLILALGGEGGGVLADWLVATAQAAGLPVQATSVPGVAQRTGATSYYIEVLRAPLADDTRQPVFCLSPTPGDIDLLVSSELLETGRALERGLTDPLRTVLLSSTARFLTVAEKMQMGDGRLDPTRLLQAGQALCREAVFFDMAAETRAAGTVISSVMFGAIAASGVLPLSRDACEATIRHGGLAVEASLAGFARGFAAVARARAADAPSPDAPSPDGPAADAPSAGAPASAAPSATQTRASAASDSPRSHPGPLAETLRLGRARVRDFQDGAYEALYERRIDALADIERRTHGSDAVSAQAARWLALWMAYEDLIRVADLKSRPLRLERIRREAGAQAHEPVVIREFFKPGVDEIAAILPPGLASRVRAWGQRRGITALSEGIRLQTTAVHGWLALRLLASLRRFRPRSSRFLQEQAAIEGWLAALADALAEREPDAHRLAMEIAQCPRLLKGYGDTWARGRRNFEALMRSLQVAAGTAPEPAGVRADRLRAAREAALRDPDGRQLAGALGLPPPAAKVYPIRIVKRQR